MVKKIREIRGKDSRRIRGQGNKKAQEQEAEAEIAEIGSGGVQCFNTEINEELSKISMFGTDEIPESKESNEIACDEQQSCDASPLESSPLTMESSPTGPKHSSASTFGSWQPYSAMIYMFVGMMIMGCILSPVWQSSFLAITVGVFSTQWIGNLSNGSHPPQALNSVASNLSAP